MRGTIDAAKFVIAVIVLVSVGTCVYVCSSVANNVRSTKSSEPEEDPQRLVIKQYAYEAFPRWQSRHPSQGCPASLRELNEFMDIAGAAFNRGQRGDELATAILSGDTRDPWGRELIMLCGSTLPPGIEGGFAVISLGADGQLNTTDDIRSWG